MNVENFQFPSLSIVRVVDTKYGAWRNIRHVVGLRLICRCVELVHGAVDHRRAESEKLSYTCGDRFRCTTLTVRARCVVEMGKIVVVVDVQSLPLSCI